jgi:SAM-dependent methyltransferase
MSENLHDQLNRLVSGYWYTQTIYVAAKFGIAELLKDGPVSAEALAIVTGTNARALYRLLRALASIGIFAEDQGRFVLTPLAECLLDPSTKAMATMRGEFQYRAWGDLLYSIQTGEPAFEKQHGNPIFDYFSEGRCNVVAGSFFEMVPTGADAYLMRHIIHDWDDNESLTILQNCRKAMRPDGKLLVVEGVVPLGNEPSVSKFFDLAMMVLPGGMERTEEEYRQLFQRAGFRMTGIVPTTTWVSVIEGSVS